MIGSANDSLTLSTASSPTQRLPNSSTAPPEIPDYQLHRLVGYGSYGQVWLARSVTGALRAIKIVYRAGFDHDRPYEREFEGIKKFEPISQMRESQVAIFHVGRNDSAGFFYYVMELADDASTISSESIRTGLKSPLSSRGEGQGGGCSATFNFQPSTFNYVPRTLKQDLKTNGPLPLPDCLQIAQSLATALDHLHSHNLVHRDIKPSNIIFVNGRSKLADIGLVTSTDATRSFVGTDGYIPPEGPGTPQADLYSLGKVLYECVTGKDRTDFPELPADWRNRRDFDRLLEFNEILTKLCDGDSRKRYQQAIVLCADTRAVQLGKSVRRRQSYSRNFKLLLGSATGLAITSLVFFWRQPPDKRLDPLTTGKNIGGYPPTVMRETTNTEAWTHYCLGFHADSRTTDEGNKDAIEHYKAAIGLDPNFTLAYARLWMTKYGDTLLLTRVPSPVEFRDLANKIVQLDPDLAETHVVLGFIKSWEWNWEEAEKEYKVALRLNPQCTPAYVCLGLLLSELGRPVEAREVLKRGFLLNPVFPQLTKMIGHTYYVERDFDKALECYRTSCRIEPNFQEGYRRASIALLALKNYSAAIDQWETCLIKMGRNPAKTKQECDDLRQAYSKDGEPGYWQRRLAYAQDQLDPNHDP